MSLPISLSNVAWVLCLCTSPLCSYSVSKVYVSGRTCSPFSWLNLIRNKDENVPWEEQHQYHTERHVENSGSNIPWLWRWIWARGSRKCWAYTSTLSGINWLAWFRKDLFLPRWTMEILENYDKTSSWKFHKKNWHEFFSCTKRRSIVAACEILRTLLPCALAGEPSCDINIFISIIEDLCKC